MCAGDGAVKSSVPANGKLPGLVSPKGESVEVWPGSRYRYFQLFHLFPL